MITLKGLHGKSVLETSGSLRGVLFVLLCLVLPARVYVKAPEGHGWQYFPNFLGLGSLGHILANADLGINDTSASIAHECGFITVVMTAVSLKGCLAFMYFKKAGKYIVFFISDPN